MQTNDDSRAKARFLTVRVRTDLPLDTWVVDWKKMRTLDDAFDLLWQLTQGVAWVGDEPPPGVSHLVKRYGD